MTSLYSAAGKEKPPTNRLVRGVLKTLYHPGSAFGHPKALVGF